MSTTKNVLITGSSSGFGRALAEKFDSLGYNVYCISRSKTEGFKHSVQCDFNNLSSIPRSLEILINSYRDEDDPLAQIQPSIKKFEYVILNAGMLGSLDRQENISTEEYKEILNVNLLSNKVILDFVLKNGCRTKNVIGISSGAALKTYFGWSLYCTSKAAFKQLISSYADEFKDTFFASVAPGIMKTNMQEEIKTKDVKEIPSVKKFHDLYPTMETPDYVAHKMWHFLEDIKKIKSGSYIDLRDLEPKEKEPLTIFCDIDGCLIEHQDHYKKNLARSLEGAIDKIKDWDRKGHRLILTTGRRESARKVTEDTLEYLGITYDKLIMGLGPNKRVLINDLKPNSKESTAIAINLNRDEGISGIDF